MKLFRLFAVFGFVALSALTSVASAENWPQWRGPMNNGTTTETNLPTTWNATEGIVWKLKMPGPAGATPVVWGDKIFLTSAAGEGDLVLICANTSGKELWQQKVSTGDKGVRGDEGNSASPSPVTDGKHVWTFMANGELACYDFDGKEVWRFNVGDRYGKLNIAFGMTSSPVMDGDRLYLQLLHTSAKLVVALDKATGKDIWQAVRPSDARDECLHSYASPIVYRDGQREFLLTHGSDYIVAHNLRDGAELWRCGGLNSTSKYNNTLRFVATPAAVPGLIVVPSAKNGPVLGLTPAGEGNITADTKTHIWVREQNTPDVPSPVISDGLVYLCRENGVLICMDAKTGEEVYKERCYSDRYRASPVAADGKIYCVSRKGVSTVVKAGRTFEKLAENDIGDAVSASPVFSGGKIYLRGFENLYCIGK